MDKQISIEQLRPGMFIHKLKGSWMDRLLWKSAFLLADPAEVKAIVDSGLRKVWIDTAKGRDVPVVEAVIEVLQDPAPTITEVTEVMPPAVATQVSFAEELGRAAKICSKAKGVVTAMFHEARMGKALEVGKAQQLVEEISSSVERNPAALISLARLKTKDDYTYMHSVAVCGLMVSLGRQLGLDPAQVRDAGLAGLLHDMGKMAIPLEVLNKPGKLTEDEYTQVKTHPEQGHAMLLEGNNVNLVVLDVCLHHHERIDGCGYPHRLKGDEISVFAKMAAMCDAYDAITSNRPYKEGWGPAESLQKMARWSKGDYEEHIFQAFVKSIGIYPTGSLLLLDSGRLCIVVEQSQGSLLQPKVKAFFSTRSKSYIPPELIDLSQRGRAEEIVGPETAAKWGIKNMDELWAGDALR